MKLNLIVLSVFFTIMAKAQQPVFTVHRGNEVNLTMMDISPDNKYAITVDKNDEAIIWDIKMGVEIKRLKEIKAAAFTNADQMVVAVSNRTGLMKRYAQNNFLGNLTPDFPLPNDAEHYTYGENARSYQPLDGVVICENKLYNINTGSYTVMGYEDKTRWGTHAKVVYSPALKAVVAGEKGGVLNIYDAATGQLKQSIDYKTDEYKSDQAAWAGVSENGKLVGLVGNGKLYVTDLTTKLNIFTLKSQWGTNGYITNAAFIDNDKLLVINEDYISLYSLATKEMLWQYEHRLAWGTASFIKVSKDKSKIFASSAYQKNILVLNTKTGTMVQHMKSSFSKVNLVMQPQYDNNIIALVGDGRALQLNLRSGMLENKNIFKLDEAYWKTKIICKENDIYCDNSYLNIFRKNARNEYKSVFEYKYPPGSSYFTDDYYVSPDNKLIVIEAKSDYINETACKKEILFVIDKTGKKQWELPACDHLFGIGIGNKKNIMALGDTLTTIFIKEIETGKTIKKLPVRMLQLINCFPPATGIYYSPPHSIFIHYSISKKKLLLQCLL